jgi:hypothetical protein
VSATAELGTEKAKSAWLVLVVSTCEMDPDVPVAVKPMSPGVTLAFAVITTTWDGSEALVRALAGTPTCCAAELPGVNVKVAGAAVTPGGSPETDMSTGFEKPFSGVTEIVIV